MDVQNIPQLIKLCNKDNVNWWENLNIIISSKPARRRAEHEQCMCVYIPFEN